MRDSQKGQTGLGARRRESDLASTHLIYQVSSSAVSQHCQFCGSQSWRCPASAAPLVPLLPPQGCRWAWSSPASPGAAPPGALPGAVPRGRGLL